MRNAVATLDGQADSLTEVDVAISEAFRSGALGVRSLIDIRGLPEDVYQPRHSY